MSKKWFFRKSCIFKWRFNCQFLIFCIRFWCKTHLFFPKISFLKKFLARAHFRARCAPLKMWKFAKFCYFLLIFSKSSEISSARQNFFKNEFCGKNRCVLHHKRMQNLQNSYLKWKSHAISQGAIYEMAWGSNSTLKPTSIQVVKELFFPVWQLSNPQLLHSKFAVLFHLRGPNKSTWRK